eukprot:TRINITY_DN11541_c0_g1_i1.p1 TRINITY_DN11541_c0_g1~~TRINITY_DN11541_c0_g1_i1.p1  ORF type:complete len:485 (+),score=118.71 TRINITY_DN11541_c0_g1_i1:105-1559(+)
MPAGSPKVLPLGSESPQKTLPIRPAIASHGRAFEGSALELDDLDDSSAQDDSGSCTPAAGDRLIEPQSSVRELGRRAVSVDYGTQPGLSTSMAGVGCGRTQSILQAAELLTASMATVPGCMAAPPKRVLVADASTLIGSYVVDELAESGVAVSAWVPEPAMQTQLRGYVETNDVQGVDVTTDLAQACAGCDHAVLCGSGSDVYAAATAVREQKSIGRTVVVGDALALHAPGQRCPAGGFGARSWGSGEHAALERKVCAALDNAVCVVPPHMVVGAAIVGSTADSRAGRRLRHLCECAWWLPFAPRVAWTWAPVQSVVRAAVAVLCGRRSPARVVLPSRCLSLAELGRLVRRLRPTLPAPTTPTPDWATRIALRLSHANVSGSDLSVLGSRPELDAGSSAGFAEAFQEEEFETSLADTLDSMVAAGDLLPPGSPPRPCVLSLIGAASATAAVALSRREVQGSKVMAGALSVGSGAAFLCAYLQRP